MPFNSNGYETRRFPDILESIRSEIEDRTGTPISTNPSNIIGIINSIIANQVSVLENNIQALSNNLDIYKAEGVYLDRAVRYLGLSRLTPQPAKGQLEITRNTTTPINNSVRFLNADGDVFICTRVDSSLLECSSVKLSPSTVSGTVPFSISLNGNNFGIIADENDDTNSIVDYFANEINSEFGYTTSNDNGVLSIESPQSLQNGLRFPSLGNFEVQEISSYNEAESVLEGFLQVSEDTVVSVSNNDGTILSVTNPFSFVSGRDLETDEELRSRFEKSLSQGGSSTFNNILGGLLELPNVTNAFILENETMTTDVDTGLPPKSYQCIVVDGSDQNIAQQIWDSKPVGVETFGSINSTVQDIKGNSHKVNWDRPTNFLMFVEVTYSKYDEESFPLDGNDLIKEAVLEYGQTLGLDNDVIPERFIGGIYRKLSGVDSVSVRVGYSTDSNDTDPESGYSSSRIPVGFNELPLFTSARVKIVEE